LFTNKFVPKIISLLECVNDPLVEFFCFLIQINVSLKKIKSFTQKICQLFDNIIFVSEGGHGHGCHLAFLIRFQRKNNFMALTLKVLFRKIVAKIHKCCICMRQRYTEVKVGNYLMFMFSPPKRSQGKNVCLNLLIVFYLI